MKKILTLGFALASLAAPFAAAAGAAQARPEQIIRVDDEWRDCRHWDRHHRQCRDQDWDRNRRDEREWYGRNACGDRHDHYLDTHGHWRMCRR